LRPSKKTEALPLDPYCTKNGGAFGTGSIDLF
jgi:hypothetical protein